MELKHYRTQGSKNGVRLYQYEDGRLTPLGERRYLKGEKNKSHYYDPGYKPGFFDLYGQQKLKELNAYKKQVGMKTYKGYERAEAKEPKIADPKTWRFNFRTKLDFSKPAAIRKRNEEWAKAYARLEAYEAEEASKKLLNDNKQTPLIDISSEQIVYGINFANTYLTPLLQRDYQTFVAAISDHRNQNDDSAESNDVQAFQKDAQIKGAKAWIDLAIRRYLKK